MVIYQVQNLTGNWDQWNVPGVLFNSNQLHALCPNEPFKEQSIHSLAFSWMKTLSNMQLPMTLKRSSLKIMSGYWQTVFCILSQRRRSWNLITKHVTWPYLSNLVLFQRWTLISSPSHKQWYFSTKKIGKFLEMCFSSVNLTNFPIVLEKFTKLSAKQNYPSYNIVSPPKMKINQMNTRKSILQPNFWIQTYNRMCTYLIFSFIFGNSQNENCNFEGVHWC
jgi:hypothetical protein